MRIQLTKPLFAWDCLEDSPSLKTVGQFLQAVPDGPLLEGLRHQRGRGRNDYPVHVLWGVVVALCQTSHLRLVRAHSLSFAVGVALSVCQETDYDRAAIRPSPRGSISRNSTPHHER